MVIGSEHFHRDPVVISQGIKRLEQKLKDEKDLQMSMDIIEKSLKRNKNRKYLFTYAKPRLFIFVLPAISCHCENTVVNSNKTPLVPPCRYSESGVVPLVE